MTDTHLTAPTRFVDVGGTRFAYRRWSNTASVQPPLLMLRHFRGGMDHWDPLMTDGLAEGREVISQSAAAAPAETALQALLRTYLSQTHVKEPDIER